MTRRGIFFGFLCRSRRISSRSFGLGGLSSGRGFRWFSRIGLCRSSSASFSEIQGLRFVGDILFDTEFRHGRRLSTTNSPHGASRNKSEQVCWRKMIDEVESERELD